ncbi:hypothetical protein [Millisia brevis]|uniref:hypothetical protein n=1 Tax=Millisia brevis TaxID=264148 RepID=UPI00083600FC|nr:hypothetical protein [Millisia brevis]
MPDGDVLRIEPGAAERIAAAFDRHADALAAAAQRLRDHSYGTGFAGFPSAVELDAGFEDKRLQAVDHLDQQEAVAREYAAKIRAAGANYLESDTGGAEGIRAAGAEVGW